MRKIILSLFIVFLSGNAFSQENSFTDDVKSLLSQKNTSVDILKPASKQNKGAAKKLKATAVTKLESEVVEKSINYMKKNFTHKEIKEISKELSSNTVVYSKKTNQFVHFWRVTQAELENKKRALQK